MLIQSPRLRFDDLACWAELEEADHVHGARLMQSDRPAKAVESIRQFAAAGPCYAGVSWGKDSVVLAHLVASSGLPVPLAWIRVEPICNPDCAAVRDAFLERFPDAQYLELEERCTHDAEGWHATGTLERGFRRAIKQYADRHISGVRGEESGVRMIRMKRWGISTEHSCAPLGWWSAADVYGYLAVHNLPVHPAYAMSFGGKWDRERLRVASLTGRRGDGAGRLEWEKAYYGDILRRLEAAQ